MSTKRDTGISHVQVLIYIVSERNFIKELMLETSALLINSITV